MKKTILAMFFFLISIVLYAQTNEEAYKAGYEDGLNNVSYNSTYQGKKADPKLKEDYENGHWQGLIVYYFDEGIKVGLREYSRVPREYQYADAWGEPIELVTSFKAGLEEGTQKYALENELKEKYTEKEYDAIIHARVFIGMSEEALIASYGRPDDINYTVLKDYEEKQYVYNRPIHTVEYIYVENGIVTGYQKF